MCCPTSSFSGYGPRHSHQFPTCGTVSSCLDDRVSSATSISELLGCLRYSLAFNHSAVLLRAHGLHAVHEPVSVRLSCTSKRGCTTQVVLSEMAEAVAVLGVAASIIAVVQVTASALRLGWSVVQTLKGTTQKSLLGLLDELTLLHGVLLTLHSQTSVPNSFDLDVAALLKEPTGPLPACKLAISEAGGLIKDLNERKFRTLLTKGNSIEKDLESSRNRIERLKTVLLLALHSDQL